MKKVYKQIVAYNPSDDVITVFRRLDITAPGYERIADETFFRVFAMANKTSEIVLGKTVGGDFYQLSPTPYSSYIKEDSTTVNRYINKSKLLCAIAKYQKEKNIPFER